MNETKELFFIGYAGEKNARRKPIEITDLLMRWPSAVPVLMVNRPKEEAPYPANTALEGTVLYWEVSDIDVVRSGYGQAQVYMHDKNGDILGKSEVINTLIKASINGTEQQNPPNAVETWVTRFLEAYEEAKDGYVPQNQGIENAGMVLGIGSDGKVKPVENTGSNGTGGGSGASINDNIISTTTTYSSQKIDKLINEQKEAIDEQGEAIAGKANDKDLAAVAKSGSYEDLKNKPTIPTVPTALKNPNKLTFTGAVSATYDGSSEVSVEIPAGGGGSGGGSSGGGNISLRLVADVTIDQENIPKRISITQDLEGNPLSMRKFLVWSDIESTVAYTGMTWNGEAWHYSIDMNHGKGWTYCYAGDDMWGSLCHTAGLACRPLNGGKLANGGAPEAKYYGPAKEVFFSTQYDIKKGTFLKVWEVLDV